MFINCPHCQALIATDPATDLPPAKCPRCATGLREAVATATDAPSSTSPETPANDAASSTGMHVTAPPITPVLPAVEPLGTLPVEGPGVAEGQARAGLSTAIAAVISPIATLLKPATKAPAQAPAPAPGAPTPESGLENEAAPPPTPENEALAPAPADDHASTPQIPVEPAATDAGMAGAAAPEPPPDAATDAATDADTVMPDGMAPEPAPDAAPSARAASASEGRPRAIEAAKALPSFARTGTPPHHGFGWKTATAAAALALLLLLQLLLAGRAQLADDARWRPLASTLCSALGCTLPPWREPAAFTVLTRDVRPHPSLPGVLRVTATLRNDARWPQPWPRLRLTLSDVDGNPVAARDFAAREYLGARSSPPQIASGQVAAFAMDIVEPAARSVAFDFELH